MPSNLVTDIEDWSDARKNEAKKNGWRIILYEADYHSAQVLLLWVNFVPWNPINPSCSIQIG
jgi:hypothetical protein